MEFIERIRRIIYRPRLNMRISRIERDRLYNGKVSGLILADAVGLNPHGRMLMRTVIRNFNRLNRARIYRSPFQPYVFDKPIRDRYKD